MMSLGIVWESEMGREGEERRGEDGGSLLGFFMVSLLERYADDGYVIAAIVFA